MQHFRAIIFDWAGTIVDFGSFAPMAAFVEAFAGFGVAVSLDEARAPMGLPKRAHISALLADPRIAAAWHDATGNAPDEAAIDRIYSAFLPLNESVAARHSTLVPGVIETVGWARARGMKIGTTTGYTRSIMSHVLPEAERQGFVPDSLVCADDLAESRPGPLGMYKSFVDLAVYPPSCVIKVDDTAPGIAEGVAAGCVTVGVALSGNHAGKTMQELAAMDASERDAIRQRVTSILRDAGADHVIDTVADLPALVERIEAMQQA